MTDPANIHLITPITEMQGWRTPEFFEKFQARGITVTHSFIKKGPSTVEDPIAMAMTVDGILGAALLAEKEKADAVVIDCTADPGISEARHAVSIPVIGAMRVALSLASDLATRTGIIFPSRNAFPVARNLYRSYADTSCIPMAATDQLVRDLTAENDSTPQALFEASLLLADENECGAIILGCTGYSPFAQTLRDRLSGIGTDIAVIDPVSVAIFTAAAMTWEILLIANDAFRFQGRGVRALRSSMKFERLYSNAVKSVTIRTMCERQERNGHSEKKV